MFIFSLGMHSFKIKWQNPSFSVRCEQDTGRGFEDGVRALAEIAYDKVTGQYMPTASMIEYYTALEMGATAETPQMDWSGDVDY